MSMQSINTEMSHSQLQAHQKENKETITALKQKSVVSVRQLQITSKQVQGQFSVNTQPDSSAKKAVTIQLIGDGDAPKLGSSLTPQQEQTALCSEELPVNGMNAKKPVNDFTEKDKNSRKKTNENDDVMQDASYIDVIESPVTDDLVNGYVREEFGTKNIFHHETVGMLRMFVDVVEKEEEDEEDESDDENENDVYERLQKKAPKYPLQTEVSKKTKKNPNTSLKVNDGDNRTTLNSKEPKDGSKFIKTAASKLNPDAASFDHHLPAIKEEEKDEIENGLDEVQIVLCNSELSENGMNAKKLVNDLTQKVLSDNNSHKKMNENDEVQHDDYNQLKVETGKRYQTHPRAHQNNALLKTSAVSVRQQPLIKTVSSKLNANAAEWSPLDKNSPYHQQVLNRLRRLSASNTNQQLKTSPTVYTKADGNGQYSSYPAVKDSALRPVPAAQLPNKPVRSKNNVFANNAEETNDDDQKNDKNGDNIYNQLKVERAENRRQGWFGKNADCYLAVAFNRLPLIKAPLESSYPFPQSKNVFMSHDITNAMTRLISHPSKALNMISKQAVNILSNVSLLRPFQTKFGPTFFINLGLIRVNAQKMYLVIIKNYKGWQVIAWMSEKRVLEMLLPKCGKLSLISVSPLSLTDITLPLFEEAYKSFPFAKQQLLNIVNNTKLMPSFIIPYESEKPKKSKPKKGKAKEDKPPRELPISYRAFKNYIAETVLNGNYVIIPTIVVKPGTSMTWIEFKLLVKVTGLEYVFVGLQYYQSNWSIKSIHCNVDRIYFQHILVCLPAGHPLIKSHDELKKYSTVLLEFDR